MIKRALIAASLCLSIKSFSQNNTYPSQTVVVDNNRWDLGKIWSHVKYKSDKPVLDFNAIDNWITLPVSDKISISPNGDYFLYVARTNHINKQVDSTVVQSTTGEWRVVFDADAKTGFFSADSKQYIFLSSNRLCFLQLGTDHFHGEQDVESYMVDSLKEWLSYRLQAGRELVLRNLISGKEHRFRDVSSFNLSNSGEWVARQLGNKNVVLRNLLLGNEEVFDNISTYQFDLTQRYFVSQTEGDKRDLIVYDCREGKRNEFSSIQSWRFSKTGDYLLLSTGTRLDYINLNNGERFNIWSTRDSTNTLTTFEFDRTEKKVVFVTDNGEEKSIWYWDAEMTFSVRKVYLQTLNSGQKLIVEKGISFSDNGRYVRFSLQPNNIDTAQIQTGVSIDVWSYQDKVLQSTQSHLKEEPINTVILDVLTDKVVWPERADEKFGFLIGDYGLITKSGHDVNGDRFWERGYDEDSVWLISLQDEQRRFLPFDPKSFIYSPETNSFVYFDAKKGNHYYTYNLATAAISKISIGVQDWQMGIDYPLLRTSDKPSSGSGFVLQLDARKSFLVYDKYYDIWELDATGKRAATCITNGYGRKHNVKFKLLIPSDYSLTGNKEGIFIDKDTLLLTAFNIKTKKQGFYRKKLGSKGDPELLYMGSNYFERLRDGRNGKFPVKASESKTWIITMQNATDAPNYFVTHDFRSFKQLSFLQPHKNYNWLTAELHSFKQLDGTISQGVLYKPENFDSKRKYPLIISFYGFLTDRLNVYPEARFLSNPAIFENPAWMVSHGYLVFIPDIYFTKNKWGPSTVNTVDAAAKYLQKLPYVDGQHIGATGHSNSGRFGYYLFTHSKSFAAMSLGSGHTGTNVLSLALSLHYPDGIGSNLEIAERTAYATALGSIWQNKQRWIDHTAVLQADKAQSPLLLFHNKKDGDDWRAAVELYTALRRLEKDCWWLQYDNGTHGVRGYDAKDWTIRFTQFFDHYLKGAPAPRWMTKGIPNKFKGIEARYELDPAGSCAIEGKNICNVCRNWNSRYKKNSNMFIRPMTMWDQ